MPSLSNHELLVWIHITLGVVLILLIVFFIVYVQNYQKMKETLLQLQTSVSKLTTVDQSAIALLNGIKTQIDAGITAAEAGDLQALKDLSTAIDEQTNELSAAVVANTPATTGA